MPSASSDLSEAINGNGPPTVRLEGSIAPGRHPHDGTHVTARLATKRWLMVMGCGAGLLCLVLGFAAGFVAHAQPPRAPLGPPPSSRASVPGMDSTKDDYCIKTTADFEVAFSNRKNSNDVLDQPACVDPHLMGQVTVSDASEPGPMMSDRLRGEEGRRVAFAFDYTTLEKMLVWGAHGGETTVTALALGERENSRYDLVIWSRLGLQFGRDQAPFATRNYWANLPAFVVKVRCIDCASLTQALISLVLNDPPCLSLPLSPHDGV